jgi:hypothetical protein
MALLAATSRVRWPIIHLRRSISPPRKTLVGTIKQFDWTNPHTWI